MKSSIYAVVAIIGLAGGAYAGTAAEQLAATGGVIPENRYSEVLPAPINTDKQFDADKAPKARSRSSKQFDRKSIVAMEDGARATCSALYEVGQRSYNLTAVRSVLNGDSRVVTFKVNFYKCAKVASAGYEFRASTAKEVLSSYFLLPNGKMGVSKDSLVKTNFFASNFDGYVLASSALADNSTITFTVKKSEKRLFVDAVLISTISTEFGNLEGFSQNYGGFVVTLE